MKKMPGYFVAILAIVCVGLLPVISGCTQAKNEGFAIYLTKENVPPAQMETLSHVNLADQPIISAGDVISYDAQTHEITLSQSAFQRVADQQVPVTGKSFLVCLDKAPVYWGAFWVVFSSLSFDGVIIDKPLDTQGPPVITIGQGYPGASFYRGEDPRNKPVILKSLEQAGKLINTR
jgi:hypothetical protein